MTSVASCSASTQEAGLINRPVLPQPAEDQPRSWLVYPVLVLLVALVAGALATFYVPAHQGPDQNAYDVMARMLVEHHRLYFRPHNAWQFVGTNDVQTPDGRIYAKYPPGMGVLGAAAWIVGGGPRAMYMVDPVCVVLACGLSFFLFRKLVGNFLALMGVIWLVCNPVVMFFADYGDSHGAALFFTVLGFWALLNWWARGGWGWGLLTGLALGFCGWIRYTEMLWFLPLLAVVVWQWWARRRPVWECLLVIAAFCVPVAILAGVNWMAFGEPWRTGYALSHEQSGFGWRYFIGNPAGHPPGTGNWQTVVRQLPDLGLLLLFPLTLAGLIRMFWSHGKLALLLALWIVPSATAYMCYYWAPDNLGYARFFIDLFPALIMPALWLLGRAMGQQRAATAVAVGTLTLLGTGYNLYASAPRLVASTASKLNLVEARQALLQEVPRGGVVFTTEGMANYLTIDGGYRVYAAPLFSRGYFSRMQHDAQRTGPHLLQRLRAKQYERLLGRKEANGTFVPKRRAELLQAQMHLIHSAWRKHQRVVFLGAQRALWRILPHGPGVRTKTLATWNAPAIRFRKNYSRAWRWALVEVLPGPSTHGITPRGVRPSPMP